MRFTVLAIFVALLGACCCVSDSDQFHTSTVDSLECSGKIYRDKETGLTQFYPDNSGVSYVLRKYPESFEKNIQAGCTYRARLKLRTMSGVVPKKEDPLHPLYMEVVEVSDLEFLG